MFFANSFQFFTLSKNKLTSVSVILTKYSVLCIKIHLCLSYFFSAIAKINSNVWFNGLATYYTLNNERFMLFKIPDSILRNSYFVTLTTYLTILWELSFPYLAWFKKTRTIMILIALLFHIFVFNYMMLYDFQMLFIMTLGFFFTDSELIRGYIKTKRYVKLFRLGF